MLFASFILSRCSKHLVAKCCYLPIVLRVSVNQHNNILFLQTTEFIQRLFHIRDDALFDYDSSCLNIDFCTTLCPNATVLYYKAY